ncbi:MAG: UPF0149 family protein [Gammaproteobacteria bacterium]
MESPPVPVDFHEVHDALEQADADTGAAEAHGLLCGMLCARAATPPGAWLIQALGRPTDAGPGQATLTGLYQQTLEAFADGDLSFHPLLPGDEAPIAARARCLGQWCDGFLAGLGLADSPKLDGFAGEISEFLHDVTEIVKIQSELPDARDEDETAYTEILEYIRMGVLLTYETLNPREPGAPLGGSVH